MRKLLALLSVTVTFTVFAADPAPDADAVWAELAKSFRPPAPPAEWGNKRPTPEQMADFNKVMAANATQVADKAKAFHEQFPNHAKAAEAKDREKSFRQQAVRLQLAANPQKPEETPGANAGNRTLPQEQDPAFAAAFQEAVGRFRERQRKEGPMGALDELDKAGRALAKQFPKEKEPWRMIFSAAQQFGPGPRSSDIYRYIMENGPAELKEMAAPEIKRAERVGKPLELAFKATDGTQVDIKKLKGKVVLVDFWATWCGPCIAFMPQVHDAYERFHSKGFEIIGISFDGDCDELARYTRKNKMPWPQFCDGKKWESAMNQEFQIRSIPTMFLIDKKGILRDMNARDRFAEKVEALLAEPD